MSDYSEPKKGQLIGGAPLVIENLSLEGLLGSVYDIKMDKVVARFVIRDNLKIEISEEEYQKLLREKKNAKA